MACFILLLFDVKNIAKIASQNVISRLQMHAYVHNIVNDCVVISEFSA